MIKDFIKKMLDLFKPPQTLAPPLPKTRNKAPAKKTSNKKKVTK
jgi:hypothetical protein